MRASILLLTSCLTLLVGCGGDEDEYEAPGVDTTPAVFLSEPDARRVVSGETLLGVEFGLRSADVGLFVYGPGPGAPMQRIDLGKPDRTELVGYGAFAGQLEVYRRQVAVDSQGIHGARIAVYREDNQGNHTNAWFSHLASDTDGAFGLIHLTEFSHWNWQAGRATSDSFSGSAWPILDRMEKFENKGRVFTILPGVFDETAYISPSILSYDALSPTLDIPGCVAIAGFRFSDGEWPFLAYYHQDFGLVEVVYDWSFADPGETGSSVVEHVEQATGLRVRYKPISGYAAPTLLPVDRGADVGLWFGGNALEASVVANEGPLSGGPEVEVDWTFRLELDPIAGHSVPGSFLRSISGRFTDDTGWSQEVVGITDNFYYQLSSWLPADEQRTNWDSVLISGVVVDAGTPISTFSVQRIDTSTQTVRTIVVEDLAAIN